MYFRDKQKQQHVTLLVSRDHKSGTLVGGLTNGRNRVHPKFVFWVVMKHSLTFALVPIWWCRRCMPYASSVRHDVKPNSRHPKKNILKCLSRSKAIRANRPKPAIRNFPPPPSAIRNKGVQFGNPETIRENQAICTNLRIDSHESGKMFFDRGVNESRAPTTNSCRETKPQSRAVYTTGRTSGATSEKFQVS